MVDIEMAEAYPLVNGNGVHHEESQDLFSVPALAALEGKKYVPGAAILAEQVAYSLSSTVFQYGDGFPERDSAVTSWSKAGQTNARGVVQGVKTLQTRSGAGIFVLGHSAEEEDKAYPESVFATSATVRLMQPVLQQLSSNYQFFKPIVAHVAAVDADFTANFVSDFVTPLRSARDSGLAAVVSNSANEVQSVSILASLFSTVLPTLHVYDGVRLAQELTEVANVLPTSAVKQLFDAVRRSIPATTKADAIPQLTNLLASFNASFNTRFSFFEYSGHPSAETVLVVLGSTEANLATSVVNVLAQQGVSIGVVNVRIYQPFSDADFLVTLPKTTRRIAVLGQVDTIDIRSILYEDVLAAVVSSGAAGVDVLDIKYKRQQAWSTENFTWIFQQLVDGVQEVSLDPEGQTLPTLNEDIKNYVFWDLDDSVSSVAARKVAQHFASESDVTISLNETYDNFSQGGVLYSELRTGNAGAVLPSGSIDSADVVVVSDLAIANSFDVIRKVAPAGKVLLKTSIKPEDFEKKLSKSLRKSLFSRRGDIEVYTINPKEVGQVGEGDVAANIVVELAFLKLVGWQENITRIANEITSVSGTTFDIVIQGITKIKENIDSQLLKLEIPESWAEVEDTSVLPAVPRGNAYGSNTEKEPKEPEAKLGTWHTAARHLIFKEANVFQNELRPELPTKNWIVTVQENKRLTPLTYDRNIFHIEFNLEGTDLKYAIGESLGIHGQNDEEQVASFLTWYGLDPEAVISIPSQINPGDVETKTVRQLFVQNLDIFGRPPKKFYELLSEYATDEQQKTRLLALGGTEGATEFKRRSEVETLTFADILEEFPSAKPKLPDLIKLVPAIKRREYSIASSQRANPTSVHLLIVEVNWRDEKNRDRYGQCTRYLSRLPVGAKVTVSVKPSVMKLPPDDTTPIIMAGLGTGLAPFRAFVQERALQKKAGKEIGPVFLYMGSRHQREEYLYLLFIMSLILDMVRNGKHTAILESLLFSAWHSLEINLRKSTFKMS
jgi:sulfite reductase (NADPH) flavoprotein alpha-component